MHNIAHKNKVISTLSTLALALAGTSNAVCEHKQQQQMTDLGETTNFSQSTQPKTPSEELLPLTNHVHELDNEMNRSDTKSAECNRHSASSRELINHLPSGNSGALTQGNNVMMIQLEFY